MIGWGGTATMPPDVNVFFHDEAVPRIARSLIRIWNSGNATLENSQIAASDPIRISLQNKDSKILYYAPIKTSNPASNCNIVESNFQDGYLELIFDYLDPGDGVVIGILHTDFCLWPKVAGSIKGSRLHEPSRKWLHFRIIQRFIFRTAKVIPILSILVGITAVLIALIPPKREDTTPSDSKETVTYNSKDKIRTLMLTGGALYAALGVFTIYSRRPPFPRSLVIEKRSTSSKSKTEDNGPISVLEE